MLGAILGGGILNGLGSIFNGAMNSVYEWENRNWKSQSDYEDYRTEYEKAISDYFLDKQMNYNTRVLNKSFEHDQLMQQLQYEYNKQLSSTAYQRAIADMEKAGLNIASLAGTSGMSAASSPGVGAPSSSPLAASGVRHSGMSTNARMMDNPYRNYSNSGSSLFNAIIAKDNRAAEIAKQELVDNARHAHRMEELREKHILEREERHSKAYRDTQQGHYYKSIVEGMNDNSKSSSSGSQWLDNFKKKHK